MTVFCQCSLVALVANLARARHCCSKMNSFPFPQGLFQKTLRELQAAAGISNARVEIDPKPMIWF
jgi:hypothetical protein